MRDSRQTVRYQQRSTGWYCDLQQTPIKKQMPSVKSCAAPLLLRQSASDQSIEFTAALIFIMSLPLNYFIYSIFFFTLCHPPTEKNQHIHQIYQHISLSIHQLERLSDQPAAHQLILVKRQQESFICHKRGDILYDNATFSGYHRHQRYFYYDFYEDHVCKSISTAALHLNSVLRGHSSRQEIERVERECSIHFICLLSLPV